MPNQITTGMVVKYTPVALQKVGADRANWRGEVIGVATQNSLTMAHVVWRLRGELVASCKTPIGQLVMVTP